MHVGWRDPFFTLIISLFYYVSIRPHAKRSFYQITDRNFRSSPCICRLRFQTHQICHPLYLKLRVVFDRDHPLIRGDICGEGIEECGLPAPRPAPDQNGIPGLDQFCQEIHALPGDAPQTDQLFHRDRLIRKPPDREDGAVQGHRLHHRVDPCAIFQPGIHDRYGLVDDPIASAHDLLDHVLQFLL